MESLVSVFKSNAKLFWPKDCPEQNSYVHFIGRAELAERPGRAPFRIYAKDIYELYVNGVFVGLGPCMSAPPLLYYDEWEISNLLVPGANAFAVKVHHGGHASPEGFRYGGLRCELELSDGLRLNRAEEWRCAVSKAYSPDTPKNVGCVGFSERYDLDDREDAWHELGFDGANFAVPVETHEIPAAWWRTRPIPYFKKGTKRPLSIVAADGAALADFGEMVFGRPVVTGRADAAGEIKMAYIEDLQMGWANGQEAMYSDLLTTARPEAFAWRSFNKRAFRYLKISGPCEIDSLELETYDYPLKPLGSFRCSDTELNQLWELCDKTLSVCIDDLYNDCPHRDKAQWMDAFVSSRAALSLYGLKALTDKAIAQHGLCSLKEGRLLSPSVSGGSLLPDYAFVYVRFALWQFQVTGDRETLKTLFPSVLADMEHFSRFQDVDGLLVDVDKTEGFVYLDNTFELNKKGKSAALNALYFGATRAAAEIARQLGEDAEAEKFERLASKTQAAFSVFKHPMVEGCFVDAIPNVKKRYLNINFSCELGKWNGSGARAKTVVHADSDHELELEYAVYAGLRISSGGETLDLPKSPSWAEQPMSSPALARVPLKRGRNELVFEVEANSLNWDLYLGEADGELFPNDSFVVEEIDWQSGKSLGEAKTVKARLWTTPELSQSTHGYIAFSGVNGDLERDKEMFRKLFPAQGYTRNYRSVRVPFFCRETQEPAELESWILPCNTPWPAFFLLSSLFDCGMGAEAMAWLRMAWGGMLKRGAVNCWEEWGDRASLCHAWGASPAHFLHHEVLGVRHESLWQGYLTLKPNLQGLEWAEGTVALGGDGEDMVGVSLKWDGVTTELDIQAPLDLPVRLDLSSLRNPRLSAKAKFKPS